MEGEECGEVDGSLKVIGGREGLGGEGVMAGMADEPLDGTEGFGVVRAEAGEPGRGIGSGDMESAASVRAEREVMHWLLRACNKFCVNGYTTLRSEYGHIQGSSGRTAEGLQRA